VSRALLLGLILAGCGNGKPTEAAGGPPPGTDPDLRIGHVMVEVGQRLEIAGRAANAERWELAAYEANELVEMFHADMSRALLPGVCDDSVSDSTYATLLDEGLPALREAASERDAEAFSARFAAASASCNACHAGCEVTFIEVPSAPGSSVPRVGAPASTPAPASEPSPASSPAPASEPSPASSPAPASGPPPG